MHVFVSAVVLMYNSVGMYVHDPCVKEKFDIYIKYRNALHVQLHKFSYIEIIKYIF